MQLVVNAVFSCLHYANKKEIMTHINQQAANTPPATPEGLDASSVLLIL